MTEYNCDSCQKELNENDKFHEYQEDAIIICDDCYKYYKHDIGRTG
tara:strand:+ start:378 stop:515 length:138 start_codon:yes stop_codon:yes gene_type:complete